MINGFTLLQLTISLIYAVGVFTREKLFQIVYILKGLTLYMSPIYTLLSPKLALLTQRFVKLIHILFLLTVLVTRLLLIMITRGRLARREFGSFPVGRSSDSLGCLKTNFKKLTNDQEYEPAPYMIILQLFFSNSIFV